MTACVFCAIAAKKIPASIVYEDDSCVAFLDLFPLRPAHVLVINKRHAQYVHELTSAERSHLFEVANKISLAIRASSFKPAAFHFNINDGKAAHQTVPHVHLHILPRYPADSAAFVGSLLAKPVMMLKGGLSRKVLDEQAAEIRQYLSE
jgi:histidine triad (HIT) family protein